MPAKQRGKGDGYKHITPFEQAEMLSEFISFLLTAESPGVSLNPNGPMQRAVANLCYCPGSRKTPKGPL